MNNKKKEILKEQDQSSQESFVFAFDKTIIPLLNFLFPTQIALMDMGSGGSYKLWAMLDPKSFFYLFSRCKKDCFGVTNTEPNHET